MKLLAALILYPSLCMAGLKYPSEKLKIMDIETLQRIVSTNLSKAQNALHNTGTEDEGPATEGEQLLTKEEGATLIRESIELVFAKPDQNNATSTIFQSIESVALEYGGSFSFVEDVVQEALDTLDRSGKDKALLRDQNTYIYILNNLMAEVRPQASEEGSNYYNLIKKIRDADIDFSDALKSHRLLNSMAQTLNPSKVAASIVGEKECAWWEFLWC